MRWALALAVALAACHHDPAPTAPPDPKRKHHAKPKPAPAVECHADADCALMPELSCCGECPPAAPFEAVTQDELSAALIEDEQRCAVDDWDCEAVSCTPPATGCDARAACADGQCVVASTGC